MSLAKIIKIGNNLYYGSEKQNWHSDSLLERMPIASKFLESNLAIYIKIEYMHTAWSSNSISGNLS